jgi:hypothetical protein
MFEYWICSEDKNYFTKSAVWEGSLFSVVNALVWLAACHQTIIIIKYFSTVMQLLGM